MPDAQLQQPHPLELIPRLAGGLTLKQRRFVDAYCGPARGNATEAAKLAGYEASDDNAFALIGYENIRKLKREINERLDAESMQCGEITAELSDIGRAEWREFLQITRKNGEIIDARLNLGDKIKALDILAKIRKMVGPETAVNVQVNVNQAQIIEQTAAELAEKHGVAVELVRERLLLMRPELKELS